MVDGNPIEIFVKQGDKTFKVTMSGESVKDIEEIKNKLGVDSTLQAIIYAIKILAEGFKEDNGEHEVDIGEKKVKLKIED